MMALDSIDSPFLLVPSERGYSSCPGFLFFFYIVPTWSFSSSCLKSLYEYRSSFYLEGLPPRAGFTSPPSILSLHPVHFSLFMCLFFFSSFPLSPLLGFFFFSFSLVSPLFGTHGLFCLVYSVVSGFRVPFQSFKENFSLAWPNFCLWIFFFFCSLPSGCLLRSSYFVCSVLFLTTGTRHLVTFAQIGPPLLANLPESPGLMSFFPSFLSEYFSDFAS